MPWSNLIDFTGRKTSRISSPDLWEDMYQKKYISEELKKELIQEKGLQEKAERLEWNLFMSDGYCYLVCFVDGLEYRNMGTGWQFTGGAKIARDIYGKRLVKVK